MNVEIMVSFRRQRRSRKSGWYPPQKQAKQLFTFALEDVCGPEWLAETQDKA